MAMQAEIQRPRAGNSRMGPDGAETPTVQVDCVTKQYNDGGFTAVYDVSFDINENEIVAIIGPSGCGKTTLLRQLAGLEHPSYGRIYMQGDVVEAPGPERGMIFQGYTAYPWLTTRHNAEFAMKINGVRPQERHKRALEHLKLVHLEHFENHYPKSLSGGMKQRVAIARALGQDPPVLLMDEPFGALDAQVRWEMEELTVEIEERTHKTIVLVTHDIQEAIYVADRIIFLTRNPGQIKEDIRLEFKDNGRFTKKEDLISHPGYSDTEAKLYRMMREEIDHIREGT